MDRRGREPPRRLTPWRGSRAAPANSTRRRRPASKSGLSGGGVAMSLEALTEQLKTQAAMNPPLGYRVTFDLGDDGVLLWDGTVTQPELGPLPESGAGDATADTVLRLTGHDLGRPQPGTPHHAPPHTTT